MNKPDFCINKNCIYHNKNIKNKHWWSKFGFYKTAVNGIIQRFRCNKCGKTFSTQTYSLNYYVKRTLSYRKLINYLSESMSLSSMARTFNSSVETVSNRIDRLARQVIVFHEYLKNHIELGEDLTADGFESFVKSQYFPNNIHFLGGKDSQYLYFLNYVLIKRKGRMSNYQKERREKLYKMVDFPKEALSKSFSQVVDEFIKLTFSTNNHVSLYTDMKPEYSSVFKKHFLYDRLSSYSKISHIRISSKKPRTKTNDIFTPNYNERETRKDQANHRRETKCFSRNACSCLNRIIVYFFKHNYMKDYRIKNSKYKGVSHAEIAGVPKNVIKKVMKVIFRKRIFISLEDIDSFGLELWCKNILTPLKNKTDYIPKYAFM